MKYQRQIWENDLLKFFVVYLYKGSYKSMNVRAYSIEHAEEVIFDKLKKKDLNLKREHYAIESIMHELEA